MAQNIETRYSPNTHIVRVEHEDGKRQDYECYNPTGYMRKIEREGKNCWHLGRTNSKGELESK